MDRWDLPLTFTFDGQEVRYGILGDEGAPPLVLLHGTPFSSYEWHRIAPLLAQRHRVYFHDMPGYGHSSMEAGQDVSLGRQNRVLAALLDHWGVDRPHVVAHDFGGATALRAWLLDGCRYRSLTLIDPVAVRPWGSPLVQHVKDHEAAFAGMPAYMHQAILPPYIRSAMHRAVADETLEGYIAPWLGPVGQAAFYRQIAQMDLAYTDAVQDRYGEIDCPVQILWGEEDQWVPVERGRELAALMPQARFIAIPDCGHLMQEDAPEAIIDALNGFL
ncbi:alpha/beta fold hydrolase [Fodinicurvata sediminis]|uniref:alpha/beta fold hydrolase n=1 Tax=Fodinicurvata sediminis TaxID=1121832 RepID=UPI0003B54150|nr:alpha/beta hydrolase [Fodinicurvata sediminis]